MIDQDIKLVPLITSMGMLIGSVTTIVISDIVQDEADGAWVRKLMIYTDDPNGQNRAPALVLTMRAEQKSGVEVQIPPRLEF